MAITVQTVLLLLAVLFLLASAFNDRLYRVALPVGLALFAASFLVAA